MVSLESIALPCNCKAADGRTTVPIMFAFLADFRENITKGGTPPGGTSTKRHDIAGHIISVAKTVK